MNTCQEACKKKSCPIIVKNIPYFIICDIKNDFINLLVAYVYY